MSQGYSSLPLQGGWRDDRTSYSVQSPRSSSSVYSHHTNAEPELDFSQPENITKADITYFIRWFTEDRRRSNLQGAGLWRNFQEYFQDITHPMLVQSSRKAQEDLRYFLRSRGVLVREGRGHKVSDELHKVANENEQTPWTQNDLNTLFPQNLDGSPEIPENVYFRMVDKPDDIGQRKAARQHLPRESQLLRIQEEEEQQDETIIHEEPKPTNKSFGDFMGNIPGVNRLKDQFGQMMGQGQYPEQSHQNPQQSQHSRQIPDEELIRKAFEDYPEVNPNLPVTPEWRKKGPAAHPEDKNLRSFHLNRQQPTRFGIPVQPQPAANNPSRNQRHSRRQHPQNPLDDQQLPEHRPPSSDQQKPQPESTSIADQVLQGLARLLTQPQQAPLPQQAPVPNAPVLNPPKSDYGLLNLRKMYRPEQQYGGSQDSFDLKLRIFKDLCTIAGVQPEAYKTAFSSMLKGPALDHFYEMLESSNLEFNGLVTAMRNHFETPQHKRQMLADWQAITLADIIQKHPNRSIPECLDTLVSNLRHVQRSLQENYQNDQTLRDKLVLACLPIKECKEALIRPADTTEQLIADIKAGFTVNSAIQAQSYNMSSAMDNPRAEANVAERGYRPRKQRQEHPYQGDRYKGWKDKDDGNKKKFRCFVCGKPDCISYNHSKSEQQQAREKFLKKMQDQRGKRYTVQQVEHYIVQFEGQRPSNDTMYDTFIAGLESGSDNDASDAKSAASYWTGMNDINGLKTLAMLNDNSVKHSLLKSTPATTYLMDEKYGPQEFQGFLVDTGAAMLSTGGRGQFTALQKLTEVKLDESSKGKSNIKFGIGDTSNIGSIQLQTPVGQITFHIVHENTPFLICYQDMKRVGAQINNIEDVIYYKGKIIPMVIKFGHPFLLWTVETAVIYTNASLVYNYEVGLDTQNLECYLNENQLRQIHRRFGHPSVRRLSRILRRTEHEFKEDTLAKITRFCHECQLHAKKPGRFKFTLHDDRDFNYSIYVDIMHLASKPTLHVVDEATSYQAARFVRSMSSQHVWDSLRACWIDTYLGPPDIIVHDQGTNLKSSEFRQFAEAMGITIHRVPIEAHHSVGKVERYHVPLKRAFSTISSHLKNLNIDDNIILQMAVKAVNDTAGPDGIVPTLLVYGAYPRMAKDDPPSPSMIQRQEAMQAAFKELRTLSANRKVTDALRMRNGPRTTHLLGLPLRAPVLVYREKDGWTGPYPLLQLDKETCVIEGDRGPQEFRSTSVKPYYSEKDDEETTDEEEQPPDEQEAPLEDAQSPTQETDPEYNQGSEPEEAPKKKGRGRPKGSKNKPKEGTQSTATEDQNLSEKAEIHLLTTDEAYNLIADKPYDPFQTRRNEPTAVCLQCVASNALLVVQEGILPEEQYSEQLDDVTMFLSEKEQFDRELSIKLRKEGKITSPGEPFEESRQKEVDGLTEQGIFKPVKYDTATMGHLRIFKSRFVDEIKGKGTKNPYEKSRLVIQAYNDQDKLDILTQSPTVQRVSTRLLLAIAISLIKKVSTEKPMRVFQGIGLYLRDISQAFVQSPSPVNRKIFTAPPKDLAAKLGPDLLWEVMKPLYGLPEAGLHWWQTYTKHYIDKLLLEHSTYDPCLLLSYLQDFFAMAALQVDDTLFLSDLIFKKLEEEKLQEAKFPAKPIQQLSENNPLDFNGGRLVLGPNYLDLLQKGQGDRIGLVDAKAKDFKDVFRRERARGAYIATVCQPEAAYALSVAAQHIEPDETDTKQLNKCLQWQLDHKDRGIRFIPLDLTTTKLFVFVDASFANNKDMSSQIGYTIVLANESKDEEKKVFTLRGNLTHWQSVKCRRVTRSVLASELFAVVQGADMAVALSSTIKKITQQLEVDDFPVIICTDSLSLYECMVKLGTMKEKRLMIDVMALRQSYERREICEFRWINGKDNPADAMTKSSPNGALTTLLDTNELMVRMEGWVERGAKEASEEDVGHKG